MNSTWNGWNKRAKHSTPVIPRNFKNMSQKTAFKLDEEWENAIYGVWHLFISDTIIVRGICGKTLSTINSIKKGLESG
jgi:hypothetical protein